MTPPAPQPLAIVPDRELIRSRWHSQRFLVADVQAPIATTSHARPPVNLAFVLDRSGSMAGDKLRLAAQAVEEGVRRLLPSDRVSVVWYDNTVDLLAPGSAATANAKAVIVERLRSVSPGGSTDLGAGWLAGCEQVARDLLADGVNRVLLLTDGLANQGMTDAGELARHAAELRLRGVSTSTFGVGDDFDEELLQGMAQAGGGRFYDIAQAASIPDHINSEVGESLEVVARDVALELSLPEGVRLESLGTFTVQTGTTGRWRVALGDLVSGQSIQVPIRLSFPLGRVGHQVPLIATLTDRDGALDGAEGRVTWQYADDAGNDAQPRVLAVDRVIARVFAARARQEAVRRNRAGDYQGARDVLEATARRIRSYAGTDPELRAIVDELLREVDRFAAAMEPRALKEAYAGNAYMLQSRDVQGKSIRR